MKTSALHSVGRRAAVLAIAALTFGAMLLPASAQPVKLRVGIGAAAEEQLWLLLARPDLAPHHGKSYTTEYTRFPGGDKRYQAFEAGALDVLTSSANAALFAAAENLEFKIISSLSRESERGFYTKFLARADSPIKEIKDLKGKTIGINSLSGSGQLWTRGALEKGGLKEADVSIVPIPFPVQAEAVKSGKIDVGMFPQPFAEMALRGGGFKEVYTSKTSAPYEEELMVLIAKDEFLKKNAAAVKDFLADLNTVTKYLTDKPKEARQAILDGKMLRLEPEIYLNMSDYYREPTGQVDAAALERMQETQVAAGFQKVRADLKKYVDPSYLPK